MYSSVFLLLVVLNSIMSEDRPRHRRRSSIPKIDLADNATTSLKSSRTARDIRETEAKNQRELNSISKSTNDSVVFRKLWVSVRILCYRHTWILPLVICIVLNLTYLLSNNYTPSNPLHRFLRLSYQVGDQDLYDKGWDDFCFVFYIMIFCTFMREFVMQILLQPLAMHFGLKSKSKILRFCEQMYACYYYLLTGPLGFYIMYHSPMWFFKTSEFWRDYPHLHISWLFKFFYLFQAGFWSQQFVVMVLGLEKKRKDYFELVLHHIITMLLISLSVMFNFTHVGLCIYITMDVSDFFLGLSKSLNYIQSRFEVPFFILFICVWFYLRHYINIKILWSVYSEFLTIGPSVLDFNAQQYKCWISQPIVFVLIFALQLLNAYWFFLIMRILYRVVFLNIVKDERSDSEDEDEEDASSTPEAEEKKQN